MAEHQALLFLPDALRDAGLPFGELTGWKSNQQGYYWVDANGKHFGYLGVPVGAMWHHTATTAYTPSVKGATGRTVANIYIGIWRTGRLWSFGGGEPMIVLASGGPANYSSGKGRREVLTQYVAKDKRFPGPQHQADDENPRFYGNRYYVNTEVIHPGDGSALLPAVWDLQVETAAILSKRFGWSEFRNIAHEDHTARKIDQKFAQGAPYTIFQQQQDIKTAMEEPAPPPPPPTGEYEMRTIGLWSGYQSKGKKDERPSVIAAQGMLAYHGHADKRSVDGACASDGWFGPGTVTATKSFQLARGLTPDGVIGDKTWKQLEGR